MSGKLSSSLLTGLTVAATLSSGAASYEIDIPTWGVDLASGGTLTVTLDVNNGLPGGNFAPYKAIIAANVTGYAGEELTTAEWDASAHRVEYTHDSGDADAGDWRFADRLPIKSRNTMIGKRSIHVYRKPGRYVHTVYAFDRAGNWGTAKTVVTVTNPDADPARIIVVAQDGDFDASPYTIPANKVRTWSEARARYIAIGEGAPRAIYFKRGETYDTVNQEMISVSNTLAGDWGVGAKPHFHVLPGTGAAFRQSGPETTIVLRNLATNGDWDPVGEKYPTGTMADYLTNWNSGMLFDAAPAHTSHILIDQCDGRNASWSFVGASSDNGHIVIHECLLKDTKEYLAFGSSRGDGSLSVLGCKYEQNLDAASGGLPRWFWNTDNTQQAGWYPNNGHSGVRVATASNLKIYACDFFGRHAWTVQMTDVYESQACIRINTNGEPGNRAEVMNCWFEAYVTGSAINNDGKMPPAEIIIRHNVFVRDPTLPMCISLQPMGCTVSANLFIVPNPSAARVQLTGIVRVGLSPDGVPAGCRNEVYSNTFVVLARQALLAPSFTPVILMDRPESVEQNNLIYAPNLDTPLVADGPLDMTLRPYAPRWKGVRKSYEYWPNQYVLPGAVPVDGSVVIPYRADRNGTMTNAAAFAGHFGKHRVILTNGPINYNSSGSGDDTAGGDYFPEIKLGSVDGLIQVAFEAGGIRITNKSGQVWPSGATLSAWLHRGSTLMAMDTATATPSDSLVSGRLLANSGARAAATSGLVSLLTNDGLPRIGSGHAHAPSGTASKGAFEVAA